jgi:hypothetical protein
MNIVIPALAFLLVSALVMGSSIQGPEEAQQVQVRAKPLKLEKPDFTWTRCNCPNGTEMGLTENDFIVFQMYMQGLEHEAQKTCGDNLYWPPSTKYAGGG